jgi:hypothetical protein
MPWGISTSPECSVFNRPEFTDDPGGYWDWWDQCGKLEIQEPWEPPPPPPPECVPGKRVDSQGNCWWIVCTPDGPVLEPCWPRPVFDPSKLLAIGLASKGIRVSVSTERGTEEQEVQPGTVRLGALVRAALSGAELPSIRVAEIDRDFWSAFEDRSGGKRA